MRHLPENEIKNRQWGHGVFVLDSEADVVFGKQTLKYGNSN
jgi:putative transposon-encoded protein